MEEGNQEDGACSVLSERAGESRELKPIIIIASENTEELKIEDILFPIDVNKEFVIGRNMAAEIDIPHQSISRKHCVISHNDNKAQIRNMSSGGMYVNMKFMKEINESCRIHNGDEIVLTKYLPDLTLKYYENISYVSSEESEMLQRKRLKRKQIMDLEGRVNKSKRSKVNNKENRHSQNLSDEKVKLDDSFTKRMSFARQSYDSQILEITTNDSICFSAEEIEKKTKELEAQFLAQKEQIEAEYAVQLKELEAKVLEVQENNTVLKAENEILMFEASKNETQEAQMKKEIEKTTQENEELKAELKRAEELVKMAQEELEKENKDKHEILEQFKYMEEVKQEALKKCLEAENMKNELDAKYKSEIETLYQKQLGLEKKISEEKEQSDKNQESESIINQMQDELDSVRQLLTLHESERQVLESEVQSKVQDFAEVLEAEAQCTICSEIFVNSVTLLGCFHTFCQYCITEWKKQKTECPICRHKIKKDQEKRNFLVDNWIRSFIEKMPAQMKAAREDLIQIRARQASGSAVPTSSRASSIDSTVSSVILGSATVPSMSAMAIGPRISSVYVVRPPLSNRVSAAAAPGIRVRAPARRQARVSVANPVAAQAQRRIIPADHIVVNQEPIMIPDLQPRNVARDVANSILISDEE